MTLTPVSLRTGVESAFWQEVIIRCQHELGKNRNLAIDASDAKAAGWTRALEMVLGLPEQFKAELEQENRARNDASAVSRYGR